MQFVNIGNNYGLIISPADHGGVEIFGTLLEFRLIWPASNDLKVQGV